jgi:hypothetical protein
LKSCVHRQVSGKDHMFTDLCGLTFIYNVCRKSKPGEKYNIFYIKIMKTCLQTDDDRHKKMNFPLFYYLEICSIPRDIHRKTASFCVFFSPFFCHFYHFIFHCVNYFFAQLRTSVRVMFFERLLGSAYESN